MDSLVLASRNRVQLRLTPVRRPYQHGRGQLPSCQAHLTAAALDAEITFSEEGWQAQLLADFFSELDSRWRGWAGERVWRSSDNELRLTATHDSTSMIIVAVQLDDGAPPRWRVQAELELDPGVAFVREARARRASPIGSHRHLGSLGGHWGVSPSR
jgi:hypothetical protein